MRPDAAREEEQEKKERGEEGEEIRGEQWSGRKPTSPSRDVRLLRAVGVLFFFVFFI